MRSSIALTIISIFVISCNIPSEKSLAYTPGSFAYDIELLKKHYPVQILSRKEGEVQVAVVGAMQGRVMTSTATGRTGNSLGWINHSLIASQVFEPHINAYGGEDRFWMGPEGGQFAIFFEPEDEFTFEDWQTPGIIDTAVYQLTRQDSSQLTYEKTFSLQNYTGTQFRAHMKRRIDLLDDEEIGANLGVAIPEGVKAVSFQSVNELTNIGQKTWVRDSGLLSIWILGMFPPSPQTTIFLPVKGGENLEAQINDAYFGEVGPDRLVVSDSIIFFKGDGLYRSKIGIPPQIAKPLMGSYDAENQVLTFVQYSLGEEELYVNSLWELQEEPYRGDVVNSYNDGPLDDAGQQLGPFYELESSSAAQELAEGEHMVHIHRTFHFTGSESQLNPIFQAKLGIRLDSLNRIFN
ncbi:MAG: DUF6786 family protein [Bacteroidota bacterium]